MKLLKLFLVLSVSMLAGCVAMPPTSTAPAVEAPAILATAQSQALPTAAPATTSTPGPTPQSYSDPFAYCQAMGTIDKPDQHYTGPAMPEAMAQQLKQATGAAPDAPLDPFLQNSGWRCMNRQVYACTVGANLPCFEKGNRGQLPDTAMLDYCRQNPAASSIPRAVLGNNWVYEWSCERGQPKPGKQVFQIDDAGFIKDIWYPISPK